MESANTRLLTSDIVRLTGQLSLYIAKKAKYQNRKPQYPAASTRRATCMGLLA